MGAGRVCGTCGGLLLGTIILVIGIVLICIGAPNEVPLWWGLTLCPVVDQSYTYVTQNLPQAGACPVVLLANQTQAQVFKIEKSVFSMDGLEYVPVLYRNSDRAILQFKLEDAEGKLLWAEGPITVSNTGVQTLSSTTPATTSVMKRELMKGGRGSASAGTSSSRTRTGSSGRYGSSTYVYSTYYGYSSCCVTSGQYVWIYRSGPRTRSGYYDNSVSDRTDCGDPSYGCAYELSDDFNRDEFEKLPFVPRSNMAWPLKMTVLQGASYSSATVTDPQMYLTFWTPDADNKSIASYILIPMGSLIIIGAIIFFFVSKACFD